MRARGKREARRPGLNTQTKRRGLKGRNIRNRITPLQGWAPFIFWYQGRRASRLPLAVICRAFGAAEKQYLFETCQDLNSNHHP